MHIYVTAAGLRYILRPKFVEIIIKKKNRNSSLKTKPEFLNLGNTKHLTECLLQHSFFSSLLKSALINLLLEFCAFFFVSHCFVPKLTDTVTECNMKQFITVIQKVVFLRKMNGLVS